MPYGASMGYAISGTALSTFSLKCFYVASLTLVTMENNQVSTDTLLNVDVSPSSDLNTYQTAFFYLALSTLGFYLAHKAFSRAMSSYQTIFVRSSAAVADV